MRRIGETNLEVWPSNTCYYRDRVLNFSQDEGKLILTELTLGEKVEFSAFEIEADFPYPCMACCVFNEQLLLLAGDGEGGDDVFAALISLDKGRLSEEAIHVSPLVVEGYMEWQGPAFLCHVSENRFLLFFYERAVWYCDVCATRVEVRELNTQMPTDYGFCTVPLRLSNGRLLVAGSDRESTDIVLIICDDEPRFEKIGDIPGKERCNSSTVLIGGRFVVGFGGSPGPLDDLWIFDLQTRRGSQVRKEGEWHPGDYWLYLAVHQGVLYLICGSDSIFISAISLKSLARLIRDGRVKMDFCRCMRLPFRPIMRFGVENTCFCMPPRL